MEALRPWLASRHGYAALVLAASLLALALYGYSTSTGLAGTADTYYYLYAAQALRHTGRLLMPDGRAYQAWPPLFAALLSVLDVSALRWVHGLAMLGTLAAWSTTARWLLPARRTWAVPLLLACSSPALVVSKFIWSETLFSLLWAGYFLALLAWLRRGGWALRLLATGLGCLLPLQRMAGLFLLAGVGLALLGPRAAGAGRPSRPVLLGHLVGAGSGLLLWQLHQWSATALGDLTRPYPAHEWLAIVADYAFVLMRWLVPLPAAGIAALPAAGWVGVLALLLLALWPRPASGPPAETPAAAGTLLPARMLYLSLLVMLSLLIIITITGRIDRDGPSEAERYLTALYPPVVLLVVRAWPASGRWTTRLTPLLLAAWLLYQGSRAGHNAYRLHQLPPADTAVWPARRPTLPTTQ